MEYDAAISPDGRWFACVSDRDGPYDAWLGQIGTGRFTNLTHGTFDRTTIRNVGFSADSSEIWLKDMDYRCVSCQAEFGELVS